ncbi:MAG: cell division protein FtsB [Bradymonadia bacterium]|jgi:cell division protein FtsB
MLGKPRRYHANFACAGPTIGGNNVAMRALVELLKTPALIVALVGGVLGFSRLTINPELEANNESLRQELGRVETRNTRLQARITRLKGEINRLRADDAESLHYARTQLGMVRPGETVFQLGAPPSR